MKPRLPVAAVIRLRDHKVTDNKKAYNRKKAKREWKKDE